MSSSSNNNYDLDGDQFLTTNWFHRAWFAGGCTTLIFTFARTVSLAAFSTSTNYSLLHYIFAAFFAYLLADLNSGIYHWAIDNYGNPKNLLFGNQIEGFLYHHKQPRAIANIPISRHHSFGAALVIFTIIPINLVLHDPFLLTFVFVFSSLSMFSLQIHAWAHTSRKDMPLVVAALQDAGVLISKSYHAPHHRPPHNVDYCSLSGIWNRFLNSSKAFVKLEKLIFQVFGVQSRSWDFNQD